MRYIIIIFSLLLLFCTCSSSARKAKDPKSLKPEELAEQELFDPGGLSDTFIISQPSFKDYKKVQAGEINLSMFEQTADSTIDSTTSIPGYRIQIFLTTNRQEAEEAHFNAIIAIIGEQVYRIFDPPFHKIRVGDFIKREDAELFKTQKLIKLYPGAWVVLTKVFPSKLAPRVLLDDSLLYTDTTRAKIDTSFSK
ncbi:hypothetical protein AMJ80_03425 [bacterium SM23_31]|nr:MAG: hypothetical protein AMJ80_03425 [bacterium SM23_31]